jgi:hypothetical protein
MSKKPGAIFSLVLMMVVLLCQGAVGQAEGWFDVNKQLVFEFSQQAATKPYMDYWNIPCSKIPSYKIYYRFQGATIDQSVTGTCAYITDYGFFTGSNELMLSGTDTSYKIWDYKNTGSIGGFIAPIPNSNDVLFFNSNAYIYRDFLSNIEPVPDTNPLRLGRLDHYKLKTNPYTDENRVYYGDGQPVSDIKANGFSFSRNGKSITLNTGRSQVVIDTKTRIARRFGETLPSDYSQSTLRTALNPSGTVAFMNHYETGNYNLYDLENCPGMNTYNLEICATRRLATDLKQHIPDFKNVELSRFLSDDSIELFVKIQPAGGVSRIDRYTVSLPESNNPKLQYLGMGDSLASGEGAGGYKAATDIETNQCHVSVSSYPYLIKNKLSKTAVETVACSGAVLKDIHSVNTLKYSDADPQSTGKDEAEYDQEIYSNFLPGYRRQIDFVRKNKPEAITLSIGGNNIGFGEKLRGCILNPGTCYSSKTDREILLKEITNQFTPLTRAYEVIKAESPKTRIYVVGYPRLALPGGDCAVNVRLNQDELQLAQDIVDDLNGVIKLAAEKAGVFYVDARDAFVGYRLCEAKSWMLAMNGVTAGKDRGIGGLKFISSETYHPNALGHVLYGLTILKKTADLTAPMPDPDDSAGVSQLESKLADTPPNQVVSQAIKATEMMPDVLFSGQRITLKLLASGYFLKPNAPYRVEIHSTPTLLAEVQPDAINELNTEIEIPSITTPGVHAVHIIGVNINGDPIDVYKDITVIASSEDYDGDGVANADDECQFIEPIGTDQDEDGLDDACDPFIDQPPTKDPESVPEQLYQSEYGESSSGHDFLDINTKKLNWPTVLSGLNGGIAQIATTHSHVSWTQKTQQISLPSNDVKNNTESTDFSKPSSAILRDTAQTSRSWAHVGNRLALVALLAVASVGVIIATKK